MVAHYIAVVPLAFSLVMPLGSRYSGRTVCQMKIATVIPAMLLFGSAFALSGESKSLEGAQRVFYPERYDYKVGDFVLSLPIGFYECAMNRLVFAQKILETGSPKPVVEQEKYLVLESDALAPRRHYLMLDQWHLLVFSEQMDLDEGYPPQLQVLRRTDASWEDVTAQVVPEWARIPKGVSFAKDYAYTTVTSSDGRTKKKLSWVGGRLEQRK